MAEKRSPMNVYTVLLAGATLLALVALVVVLVRSNALTDVSPIDLLRGKI